MIKRKISKCLAIMVGASVLPVNINVQAVQVATETQVLQPQTKGTTAGGINITTSSQVSIPGSINANQYSAKADSVEDWEVHVGLGGGGQQFVEYQIDVKEQGLYKITYHTGSMDDSSIKVLIDGREVDLVEGLKSGDYNKYIQTQGKVFEMEQGVHKLRVLGVSGYANLHKMEIKKVQEQQSEVIIINGEDYNLEESKLDRPSYGCTTPFDPKNYAVYDVTVPKAGDYALAVVYQSGADGGTKLEVVVNEQGITNSTLEALGGWDGESYHEKVVVEKLLLQAGTNKVKLTTPDGGFHLKQVKLIPVQSSQPQEIIMSGDKCTEESRVSNKWDGGAAYDTGSYAFYEVEVEEGGNYEIGVAYSTTVQPSLQLECNGQIVDRFDLDSTGGWGEPGTIKEEKLSVVALNAGKNVLRIDAKQGPVNINQIKFIPTDKEVVLPELDVERWFNKNQKYTFEVVEEGVYVLNWVGNTEGRDIQTEVVVDGQVVGVKTINSSRKAKLPLQSLTLGKGKHTLEIINGFEDVESIQLIRDDQKIVLDSDLAHTQQGMSKPESGSGVVFDSSSQLIHEIYVPQDGYYNVAFNYLKHDYTTADVGLAAKESVTNVGVYSSGGYDTKVGFTTMYLRKGMQKFSITSREGGFTLRSIELTPFVPVDLEQQNVIDAKAFIDCKDIEIQDKGIKFKDWTYAEYAVNLAYAGSYDLVLDYAQGGEGSPVKLYVNGQNVVNSTFEATGGWEQFREQTQERIYLDKGLNVIKVSVELGSILLKDMSVIESEAISGGSSSNKDEEEKEEVILPKEEDKTIGAVILPGRDYNVKIHNKGLEGHWAQDAIIEMSQRGLYEVKAGLLFKEYNVQRGEVIRMLGKLFAPVDKVVGGAGETVEQVMTVEDAAQVLQGIGLLSGDENGNLRVEDDITRAEVIALFGRLTKQMGMVKPETNLPILPFKDHKSIPGWAKDSIYEARLLGIITGDETGCINATQPVTNAELCSMMQKVLELQVYK